MGKTCRDVITRALRTSGVTGVGQQPVAEDINDGFDTLNNMLGQWSRKRNMIYDLQEVVIQSTGAQSYTVGTGGLFDVPRPDEIESAFCRLTNGQGVDYPMSIIEAREDYNRITLKGLASFPGSIFYDSGWPLGVVYFWPIPNATFELHIFVKRTIGAYLNLSDQINLPPEYMEALDYNLAARFCINYAMPIPSGVAALAKASMATIRSANTQISELQMPAGIGASWRGMFAAPFVGGSNTTPTGPAFILDQSLLDVGTLT